MPKLGQTKANAKPRTLRERAYDGSPARKKARAERNKTRAQATKAGRVSKGDGKVVNHKKPIKKGLAAAKSGGTSIQTQKQSDKSGSKVRDGRSKPVNKTTRKRIMRSKSK